MKLLAIESSGLVASAAVFADDTIVAEFTVNNKQTHSQTLLPMIDQVVTMSGIDLKEIDAIATTSGPGSFTGVRIGVATVKGLAFEKNIPCISVSTLEAIACNFIKEDAIVCAVMDARRMQFYNAVFEIKNGTVKRLCKDRAISIDDLRKDLAKYSKVIIAGDGAKLCFDNLNLDNAVLSPNDKMYQCAQGVACAANSKEKISAAALMPIYLRLSQAERELKLKKER